MLMKNTLTPVGIEPAIFRFVAQHLNHCATTVPISLQIVRLKPTVKSVHVYNWQLYLIFRMVLSMRGLIVITFQL